MPCLRSGLSRLSVWQPGAAGHGRPAAPCTVITHYLVLAICWRCEADFAVASRRCSSLQTQHPSTSLRHLVQYLSKEVAKEWRSRRLIRSVCAGSAALIFLTCWPEAETPSICKREAFQCLESSEAVFFDLNTALSVSPLGAVRRASKRQLRNLVRLEAWT